MFSCDWCGDSVKRLWEIPRNTKGRDPQWVCLECHKRYERGELDDQGEPAAKKPDSL